MLEFDAAASLPLAGVKPATYRLGGPTGNKRVILRSDEPRLS